MPVVRYKYMTEITKAKGKKNVLYDQKKKKKKEEEGKKKNPCVIV